MIQDKIEWMRRRSRLFKKCGSFLPEQELLIKKCLELIQENHERVVSICAPPASGKTHILVLVANLLRSQGEKVAVVAPCGELVDNIIKENKNIESPYNFEIMTLSQFIQTEEDYDYLFIDEAHCIKSFAELDRNVIKNFYISYEDNLFVHLESFLPPKDNFVAQILHAESAKRILKVLVSERSFKKSAVKLLSELSKWKGIIYISKNWCRIIFVPCDYIYSMRLPLKKMILFSATPLSREELIFYCGIPQSEIGEFARIDWQSDWREKQRTYFTLAGKIAERDKIDFIGYLISNSPVKVLVLLTNSERCRKYYEGLKDLVGDRLFCIPSGLKKEERIKIFREYNSSNSGVLITSSIYWEGVNVDGLRLLIIPDAPYPRPSLQEITHGIEHSKRKAIGRRLEQGLGRIGRKKNDWGVGILLFDPKKYLSYSVIKSFIKKRIWEIPTEINRIFIQRPNKE